MRPKVIIPVGMGIMMGAMALMMIHGVLTGNGGASGVLFVLAHVAVIGLAAVGVAFGLHRRWPVLARVLAHRPTLRHVGLMLAVALATAGIIHLVHGAPTWT
ncbi:hypothetical protein [Marivita sp.]|uniref:hypothetical protein n=1 Tax=Marivita sp. TaxID=2003365 RepID=UPI003F6B0A4E